MTDNDKLPPKARAKIFALVDQAQQASTLMHSTLHQIRELRGSLNTTSTSQHAAINNEVERLEPLRERHAERYRALGDLNGRIRHFFELLPADAALDDAKPIKMKLKENETHLKAVQRLRGEIIGLISERGRVERSTPTLKEMKALAANYVQSLAATPRLLIGHDKFVLQFGRGVIGERDPTPLEVLAWIEPATVLQRLEALIDQRAKSDNQMTAADRKSRLDEIKDQLFELERIEQAHIEAVMAEGTIIEQRPNVDIRALLGLVIVREKANAA